MKKEVVLAIIIGLGLGLVITYGVYRARTSLLGSSVTSNQSAQASPTPSGQTTLVVNAPLDESIQSTSDVTIAGTTTPNSFVVTILNDNQTITTADESGNFSVEEELEEGANIMLVFSVDEDGNTTETERTVIYNTASTEETTTEEDES